MAGGEGRVAISIAIRRVQRLAQAPDTVLTDTPDRRRTVHSPSSLIMKAEVGERSH